MAGKPKRKQHAKKPVGVVRIEGMQPGETRRFSCFNCPADFDITFEPTAAHGERSGDFEVRAPMCCPFCSGQIFD